MKLTASSGVSPHRGSPRSFTSALLADLKKSRQPVEMYFRLQAASCVAASDDNSTNVGEDEQAKRSESCMRYKSALFTCDLYS